MVLTGTYYRKQGKYNKIKKYYQIAISNHDDNAMFVLGLYYYIHNKWDKMKKILFNGN